MGNRVEEENGRDLNQVKKNDLGLVVDSWYTALIANSSADDQTIFIYSKCVFWKEALTRSENAVVEKALLPAVSVTAESQINREGFDILFVVFGLVADQQLIAFNSAEYLEPLRIRR